MPSCPSKRNDSGISSLSLLTRKSVRGHGPWYIDCTSCAGYGNNNENSVLRRNTRRFVCDENSVPVQSVIRPEKNEQSGVARSVDVCVVGRTKVFPCA